MSDTIQTFPVPIVADFSTGRAVQAVDGAMPNLDDDKLIGVPMKVLRAFIIYAQVKLSEASVYTAAQMTDRMSQAEFDAALDPKLAEMRVHTRHLVDVLEDAGLISLHNSWQDALLAQRETAVVA